MEQEALAHPAYRHHVRAARRQHGNRQRARRDLYFSLALTPIESHSTLCEALRRGTPGCEAGASAAETLLATVPWCRRGGSAGCGGAVVA